MVMVPSVVLHSSILARFSARTHNAVLTYRIKSAVDSILSSSFLEKVTQISINYAEKYSVSLEPDFVVAHERTPESVVFLHMPHYVLTSVMIQCTLPSSLNVNKTVFHCREIRDVAFLLKSLQHVKVKGKYFNLPQKK